MAQFAVIADGASNLFLEKLARRCTLFAPCDDTAWKSALKRAALPIERLKRGALPLKK